MSLDVWLTLEEKVIKLEPSSKIYIRAGGRTQEISREIWDVLCPDREPVELVNEAEETSEVFSWNITHNLGEMARKAGVYEYLWRPEEVDITYASQLIEPLTQGLQRLVANPDHWKQFNPANGWGDYEGLVEFIQAYLVACIKYPTAKIGVFG